MAATEHVAGPFVDRPAQGESLGGSRPSGDGAGAPVHVTDVREPVQVMGVPEPGGHLGVAAEGELGVPEEVEVGSNTEVTTWFWNTHHLNGFSDVGDVDGCTRAIAGGEATPERLALSRTIYERACHVLGGCHELAA